MNKKVIEELSKIVGPEYISTNQDVLIAYSMTGTMESDEVTPGAVVRPADSEQVSNILKIASKHDVPVTPRAGGSSLQEEAIPEPEGLVVELMRLTDIKLHKELRSVTVGAGVTYGVLDKYLKEHNLFLPVYPESALVCTVAGNVAVNGAGPGSSHYGCTGELVLGVEIVLPNGNVITTGSEANPYASGPYQRYSFGPDLTGLFIGSLGSFGIITKVSMKVFKRHKFYDHNTFGFETHEQAEQFMVDIKQQDINGNRLKAILDEIIAKAHHEILLKKEQQEELSGMGTTMTCLLMKNDQYAWANIGDSRIYKITENSIQQITEDHTYIQDYIQKNGSIPEGLARQYSHYILKVIDGQSQKPDLFPQTSDSETMRGGEVFLLCSDGLILDSADTNTNLLKNYVLGSATLEQAAEQLYDYAFHSGSSDNISIVLVEYGKIKRKMLNLRRFDEDGKVIKSKLKKPKRTFVQWFLSLFT